MTTKQKSVTQKKRGRWVDVGRGQFEWRVGGEATGVTAQCWSADTWSIVGAAVSGRRNPEYGAALASWRRKVKRAPSGKPAVRKAAPRD